MFIFLGIHMQWKNSNTASIKIDFNVDGILNYTAVVLCTGDTAHQTTSITFGTVYCVGFQENVVQKYIFIANIDGALTIYQPHIYYTPSTANSHRLINIKCVVSFDFCRIVVLIVCSMYLLYSLYYIDNTFIVPYSGYSMNTCIWNENKTISEQPLYDFEADKFDFIPQLA